LNNEVRGSRGNSIAESMSKIAEWLVGGRSRRAYEMEGDHEGRHK